MIRDLVKRNGDLFNLVDRVFDDWGLRNGVSFSNLGVNIPMDVRENEKEYKVTLEIAGVPKDKINIEYDNGTLSVSGEKSQESNNDKDGYHYYSREWGSFKRAINFPKGDVDENAISADSKDGVLEIVIPKKEVKQKQTKRIELKK